MSSSIRKLALVTALAAGALTFAAPAATLAGPGHKSYSFGKPGKEKQVTRVVRLIASDVKFDAKVLRFRVGETVKFVVKNVGEADHEMTIGDAATQLAHRKEMEKMMEIIDIYELYNHEIHEAQSETQSA